MFVFGFPSVSRAPGAFRPLPGRNYLRAQRLPLCFSLSPGPGSVSVAVGHLGLSLWSALRFLGGSLSFLPLWPIFGVSSARVFVLAWRSRRLCLFGLIRSRAAPVSGCVPCSLLVRAALASVSFILLYFPASSHLAALGFRLAVFYPLRACALFFFCFLCGATLRAWCLFPSRVCVRSSLCSSASLSPFFFGSSFAPCFRLGLPFPALLLCLCPFSFLPARRPRGSVARLFSVESLLHAFFPLSTLLLPCTPMSGVLGAVRLFS